jgi:hypothetical protein
LLLDLEKSVERGAWRRGIYDLETSGIGVRAQGVTAGFKEFIRRTKRSETLPFTRAITSGSISGKRKSPPIEETI